MPPVKNFKKLPIAPLLRVYPSQPNFEALLIALPPFPTLTSWRGQVPLADHSSCLLLTSRHVRTFPHALLLQ